MNLLLLDLCHNSNTNCFAFVTQHEASELSVFGEVFNANGHIHLHSDDDKVLLAGTNERWLFLNDFLRLLLLDSQQITESSLDSERVDMHNAGVTGADNVLGLH